MNKAKPKIYDQLAENMKCYEFDRDCWLQFGEAISKRNEKLQKMKRDVQIKLESANYIAKKIIAVEFAIKYKSLVDQRDFFVQNANYITSRMHKDLENIIEVLTLLNEPRLTDILNDYKKELTRFKSRLPRI